MSRQYDPEEEAKKPYAEQHLVYRLRKRAEIRRQIDTRKSVKEGKPDRLSDLLEEAADEIDWLKREFKDWHEWSLERGHKCEEDCSYWHFFGAD